MNTPGLWPLLYKDSVELPRGKKPWMLVQIVSGSSLSFSSPSFPIKIVEQHIMAAQPENAWNEFKATSVFVCEKYL